MPMPMPIELRIPENPMPGSVLSGTYNRRWLGILVSHAAPMHIQTKIYQPHGSGVWSGAVMITDYGWLRYVGSQGRYALVPNGNPFVICCACGSAQQHGNLRMYVACANSQCHAPRSGFVIPEEFKWEFQGRM